MTLVVPFPAGGGTDALARLLATRLQPLWSVPVLVENRPGAGTTLATAAVAKAAPDGRTLVMASLGHAAAPALYPQLSYDPVQSFAPVGLAAVGPNLLLVHPEVPASNVRELVELARREPGRLSYASFGNGTSAHLAAELFAMDAGIEIVHVPYKGSTPALVDLIGGRVQMMFDGLPSMGHVRSGRLRALAVTSASRWPAAFELPTVAESGIRELMSFTAGAWFGLLAPAGVSAELQSRMNADLRTVLRQPEVRQAIDGMGFAPVDLDVSAFGRFISEETRRWTRVVRERGIKAG